MKQQPLLDRMAKELRLILEAFDSSCGESKADSRWPEAHILLDEFAGAKGTIEGAVRNLLTQLDALPEPVVRVVLGICLGQYIDLPLATRGDELPVAKPEKRGRVVTLALRDCIEQLCDVAVDHKLLGSRGVSLSAIFGRPVIIDGLCQAVSPDVEEGLITAVHHYIEALKDD